MSRILIEVLKKIFVYDKIYEKARGDVCENKHCAF